MILLTYLHIVNPAYDEAKDDITRLEQEFESYLRDMKKKTGISDLNYWGNNKDRYQIEVPMDRVNKVPNDWVSKSQKKTHRRYWTTFIETTLKQLQSAEDRLVSAQKDTLRNIFMKFNGHIELWNIGIFCIATYDALVALMRVSGSYGYCRPQVYDNKMIGHEEIILLDIQNGRHPMVEFAFSQR
jgi:DNA mismatch repair protein MutS